MGFPIGFNHALLKHFGKPFAKPFQRPSELLRKSGFADRRQPWDDTCLLPGNQVPPQGLSAWRARREAAVLLVSVHPHVDLAITRHSASLLPGAALRLQPLLLVLAGQVAELRA